MSDVGIINQQFLALSNFIKAKLLEMVDEGFVEFGPAQKFGLDFHLYFMVL